MEVIMGIIGISAPSKAQQFLRAYYQQICHSHDVKSKGLNRIG